MKLSDAIALGAKLNEQGFGSMMHKDKTCALGAAMVTMNITDIRIYSPEKIFTELFDNQPEGEPLKTLIIKWNDTFRLSREEIADKLAKRGY